MLRLLRTSPELRAACDEARGRGQRVGLVPTLGALHEGHLCLVDEARRRASVVVVTIFLNPTQFGPDEDLDRYPQNLERDLELCRGRGVDLVFAPSPGEMYPPGDRTRVRVPGLSDVLCGPKRPGHFEGVATVVTKLLSLAGPCAAIFGRKDYQQLKVIERLVQDLLLPVEIVAHPTVREPDGLALSSRNVHLRPDERVRALDLPRALSQAHARFERGERRAAEIRVPAESALREAGFVLDYVSLADPDDLSLIADDHTLGDRALLAVAAFLGPTRLIDNLVLGEDPPPITEGVG